jgi:hypothetical protein
MKDAKAPCILGIAGFSLLDLSDWASDAQGFKQQFPVLPNDYLFSPINKILSQRITIWDSKIHKNHVTHFFF